MELKKTVVFHRPSVKKSSNEDVGYGHLTSVCSSTTITPNNGQSKLNIIPNPSWNSADSFCNLKIEIMNNNASTSRKRRLDDSCLDDTFETPDKNLRVYLRKRFYPDLGYVMVSSDPLPERHTEAITASKIVSPGGNNLFGDQDKGQALPGLKSEQVHGGQSEEWDCCKGGLVPSTLPGSDSESNPVFDCDVEDIMCLSPIRSDDGCSSEGLDEFLENCQSFNENGGFCFNENGGSCKSDGQSKPTPCLGPLKTEATELGEEKEMKVKKKEVVKANTVQQERSLSDEGYFTRSYLHKLRVGRDVSNDKKDDVQSQAVPCVNPLKKEATYPVEEKEIKKEKEELYEDTGEHEECLSNEGYFTRSYLHACSAVSCTLNEDSFNISGAPLIPVESAGEGLEGTTGEAWDIGSPVLQSSLCHCDTERASVVGGEGEDEREGDVLRPAQDFQDTLGAEDTSYETTLPLQVQVRSVVVVPTPKDNGDSCKPPSPPFQPRDLQKAAQSQHRRSKKTAPRPMVYESEERWQHEMHMYVDRVTSHMMEQREDDVGLGNGVMTEWRNLMSRVAEQRPGTKHSSDLTCRNYQQQFGYEKLTLTLDQWQNHSFHKNHKRFAQVPLYFKRSPV